MLGEPVGEDNYRLNLWFEKTHEMGLNPNIFERFDSRKELDGEDNYRLNLVMNENR